MATSGLALVDIGLVPAEPFVKVDRQDIIPL